MIPLFPLPHIHGVGHFPGSLKYCCKETYLWFYVTPSECCLWIQNIKGDKLPNLIYPWGLPHWKDRARNSGLPWNSWKTKRLQCLRKTLSLTRCRKLSELPLYLYRTFYLCQGPSTCMINNESWKNICSSYQFLSWRQVRRKVGEQGIWSA